ncbi:alpha-D-ribose 1-methylphosphonate 5-triphosphate diphosphatase [Rhodovibrio salinarum]|uniref:Alpha-D-ribose 1-methylphosphonate 5-triphosphate diphosphatase n=1 Tax=Rhodovibrio salinarum TaxID=1087 RepID=A0A934V223_9PROT|nr:alpha-D-ribose 1-methylphosphonate 5-triphosphate diphosphatase [Rhodovibrio salinarum]
MTLVGGRTLLPDGSLEDACVTLADGRIASVHADEGRPTARRIDLAGRLLLPGIVDLHGDAFEHVLMPRSGVRFPMAVALAEIDRQLVANGITTAFHSLTYSWEPGLRGRDTVVELMAALDRLGHELACQPRVHLRFELHNVDAVDEVAAWLDAGRIDLLSLNDHLEMIVGRLERLDKLAQYAERTGLSIEQYQELAQQVARRGSEVPDGVARVCAAARAADVPIASHDDETPEACAHFHALGARLCEFPCNLETAEAAAATGDSVILGSPNVVRGGSHDARLTAEDAVRAGLCDVLTTDYYYPAPLLAAFQLVAGGVCDFAAAWDLVSGGPARAAGLSDRGMIAVGQRADLLAVDDSVPGVPRVSATWTGGRMVHRTSPEVGG